MAYIPTEWQTGDIITAEKLNKLENGVAGIGNGVVLAEWTGPELDTLSLTWKQIYDYALAGIPVFTVYSEPDFGGFNMSVVGGAYPDIANNRYVVLLCELSNAGQTSTLYCATADDYPAFPSD